MSAAHRGALHEEPVARKLDHSGSPVFENR